MNLLTSKEGDMNKPRILLYDIETMPLLTYTWSRFNDIRPEMVIKESSIITIAYKFLGEKSVHLISVIDYPERYAMDPYDDSEVLQDFLPILESADIIVAHNGDKFDNKIIAGRLLANGLSPMPIITALDSLKMLRSNVKMSSLSLDYFAKLKGLGTKGSISWKDWRGAAEGDVASVKRMGKYNKQDVVLLEKVFNMILPYTTLGRKLNSTHFHGGDCPSCASKNVHKRGYTYTMSGKKQRFQCTDCGAWHAKLIPKSEIQAQVAELLEDN